MKIRLAAYLQPDSIVDGDGIRTVIWTQGCKHNCPKCHNPETHDMNGGALIDVDEIKNELKNLLKTSENLDFWDIFLIQSNIDYIWMILNPLSDEVDFIEDEFNILIKFQFKF